jgi:hypothetical protein
VPSPIHVSFCAGEAGGWAITRIAAVSGEALPDASRLAVGEAAAPEPSTACRWRLRGTTSNMRYTERREADALASVQQGLGRPQALRAALIPIRKSEAWWALAQDERRRVFEDNSRHIAIGMDYLPAIARRLHHARELGEPFDFLTWFEFAPEHESAFDHMLERLRATPEWDYVEREVEVRLSRVS